MKAGSDCNAASKEDLVSSRKGMERDEQDDGCGARERRTRSGFTALGKGQTRKEGAVTDTSNSGRRRTPRKVSVEEDVVFKGLRQVPLTPRSAGRSKLFGRLHAQVFGSEEPQGPTLSHPLEASPERRRTPTKARRSLAKSPKQQQRTSPRVSTRSQRPPPRSSWLSPYCKQYMVNPVPQARHQTPLQKLHHISNAKDLHLSPPRSATPELDFDHVASPIRGTLDKENSPTQTVSLDGQVRSAPSMESLESTPDGVLSVLGEQSSQAWREMR